MKRSIKILSVVLTAAMIFATLPMTLFAEDIREWLDSFASDEVVNVSGKDIFELTDRRTATTKHFRLEDGSFYVAQYDTDIHYLDENGEYQDIDNSLSVSGSEISTSNAKIKFAKETTGNNNIFTIHNGSRKLTLSLDNANKKIEGKITNNETEFGEDATQLQKMTTLDNVSAAVIYEDILTNTDLEYVINGLNIKENIIVKAKADSYSYSFTMQLNNLTAELDVKGSIYIYDTSTNEVTYTIPAPVMWDSGNARSDAVSMALTPHGNGKYTLTVTADSEWMNSSERVYPITIDPPIYTSSESPILDLDICSMYKNRNQPADTSLYVSIPWHTYWKLTTLPDIPSSAYITNAEFTMQCYTNAELNGDIMVYDVVTDWDSTLTWNKMISSSNPKGKAADTPTDYQHISTTLVNGTYQLNKPLGYTWNVTPIVRKWYNGQNYGFTLKDDTTTVFVGEAHFRSNDYATANKRPILHIEYRDMKGVEDYYSYTAQNIGNAGTGYVNNATGSLTLALSTLTTTDALFGYSPSLVYNSSLLYHSNELNEYRFISSNPNTNIPYTSAQAGYGFKLSMQESIVRKTYIYREMDASETTKTYYVWTDSDGTEHDFLLDENGDYRDQDGLGLKLRITTSTITMTDRSYNQKIFTAVSGGWIMTSVKDTSGNELVFTTDSNNRVTKISVKPNGLTAIEFLTLTYNSSGLISRIENASAKRAVTFLYSSTCNGSASASDSGYLRQVNYVHFDTSDTIDCSVYYTYDSDGNLLSAKDGLSLYKVSYTYDFGKVISVTEYGGSSDTTGQTIGITYNGDVTVIRGSGTNDIYGDSDDILTKYAFDYAGRTVSAYSTDLSGTTVYGASSGEYVKDNELAENHIKTSSSISDATANYITNGGFELLDTNGLPMYWDYYAPYSDQLSIRNNTSKFGSNEIEINAYAEEPVELYQYVTLKAGEYTLSAEFSASNAEPCYIELEVVDTNATIYTQHSSYDQGSASENQMFASLTFLVTDFENGRDTVRVAIKVSPTLSSTNVYIDNVTLQEGNGVGKFSYVNYGSFEQSLEDYSPSTFWSMTDGSALICEAVTSEFDESLKVTGLLAMDNAAIQTITFSHLDASKQPTFFRLSGFGKAESQMMNEDSAFRLRVKIYYDNGNVAEHTADFNKESKDWQFVNAGIPVDNDAKITQIKLYCDYDYNFGDAYFDDIKLVAVEDHTVSGYVYDEETGLTEAYITGLGSTFYTYYEQYEEDPLGGLLQSAVTTGTNKFTYYSYDHNTKKVTREDVYTIITPLDIHATFTDVQNDLYYYIPFTDMGNATDGGALLDYGAVTYTYNTYGLLTQTTSTRVGYSYPSVSTASYNITSGSKIFGSVSEQTDTNGYVTKYFYNSDNGELLAAVSGKSGESTYDYGYAYTYDVMGRVTKVVPASCSASATSATLNNGSAKALYAYNAQSRLASIQTTSTTYNFTYDDFGNADTIGVGSVNLVDYAYNSKNGKLLYETYANNFGVKYTYDTLDRIKEIWYNNNVKATTSTYYIAYTYTYDTNGNIAKLTDHINNEETVFKYDTSGRPVYSCKYNLNNTYGSAYVNKYSIQVAYDDQSRISLATYSLDYMSGISGSSTANLRVDYMFEYDEENRLASSLALVNSLGGYQKEYTYDAFNRLSETNYTISNGSTGFYASEGYAYVTNNGKATSQVLSYSSTVNGAISDYTFSYDKKGNIIEIRDNIYGTLLASFEYDSLNRLTRENNSELGKTYVYTYNEAGNITSKKTYAFTTSTSLGSAQSTNTYAYTNSNWGDQLTAYNGAAITYDANGNPLSYNNGSSYTFTWTQGRRLASATKGTTSLSFTYNESGIRTTKTVGTVVHEYTLDGTKIVAEKWGVNSVTHYVEYIYDANSVIGMIYHNTTMAVSAFEYYFFEKNLQGDIVAVYNATGTKLVTYTYDAWGNVTTTYYNGGASTAAQYNSFRYRGYYYDSETGLYYLNSRYYDPATGRFINPDIYINANGDLTGFNMYAYCSGNPVVYADYTGEDAIYLTDTDGAYGFGHTGLLIQNSDGVWYHFYWGDSNVSFRSLGIDFSYTTFNDLNRYLATNNIYGSAVVIDARGRKKPVKINAYESYYYFEGDFSESFKYAKYLSTMYKAYDYPRKNSKYKLITNNCMQVSKEVLNKSGVNLNNNLIRSTRRTKITFRNRLINHIINHIDWENIIPNGSQYHTGGKTS